MCTWLRIEERIHTSQSTIGSHCQWFMVFTRQRFFNWVYTKPVDGVFRTLWLATQTQDSTVLPKGKLSVASRFVRYANHVSRYENRVARYANRVARESLKRQFWHKLGMIYRWNSRSDFHELATALRCFGATPRKKDLMCFWFSFTQILELTLSVWVWVYFS